MEEQVDISVITINYNGLKDTCEFLESWIATIKSISYELIVVDNASKSDEATIIETKYPQVIVIRSEENLGLQVPTILVWMHLKGSTYFF